MAEKTWIVSKADTATLFSVSRPRITQMVAEGMPVRSDGRVDLRQAIAWRFDALAVERETGADSPELERWRRIRADRESLALERERGKLVDATAVALAMADLFVAVRQRLRSVGQAVGPVCAGAAPMEVKQLVDGHLESACEDFARQSTTLFGPVFHQEGDELDEQSETDQVAENG